MPLVSDRPRATGGIVSLDLCDGWRVHEADAVTAAGQAAYLFVRAMHFLHQGAWHVMLLELEDAEEQASSALRELALRDHYRMAVRLARDDPDDIELVVSCIHNGWDGSVEHAAMEQRRRRYHNHTACILRDYFGDDAADEYARNLSHDDGPYTVAPDAESEDA